MRCAQVSNFARPGHRCAHNMAYWTNDAWHAFGALISPLIAHHSACAALRRLTLPCAVIQVLPPQTTWAGGASRGRGGCASIWSGYAPAPQRLSTPRRRRMSGCWTRSCWCARRTIADLPPHSADPLCHECAPTGAAPVGRRRRRCAARRLRRQKRRRRGAGARASRAGAGGAARRGRRAGGGRGCHGAPRRCARRAAHRARRLSAFKYRPGRRVCAPVT